MHLRSCALAVLALASGGQVLAQYKCVDGSGRTTFQQAPCSGAVTEQKISVQRSATPPPAPPPRPASAPLTADQRILARMEGERSAAARADAIRGVEGQIAAINANLTTRNDAMSQELEALRFKKQAAKNNLAGATWEQSISSEMQAVTNKYALLNNADSLRLQQLRADLASLRAAR